jgi:hypothetical protein
MYIQNGIAVMQMLPSETPALVIVGQYKSCRMDSEKMQGAARSNANHTVGCGICVYRYAAAISSNARSRV